MINGIPMAHQLDHAVDKAAGQRTADTAICKLHDLAVLVLDQRPVDIQRSKVIDKDRKADTPRCRQDAVKQGCLACAEEPSNDGKIDRWMCHPERTAA